MSHFLKGQRGRVPSAAGGEAQGGEADGHQPGLGGAGGKADPVEKGDIFRTTMSGSRIFQGIHHTMLGNPPTPREKPVSLFSGMGREEGTGKGVPAEGKHGMASTIGPLAFASRIFGSQRGGGEENAGASLDQASLSPRVFAQTFPTPRDNVGALNGEQLGSRAIPRAGDGVPGHLHGVLSGSSAWEEGEAAAQRHGEPGAGETRRSTPRCLESNPSSGGGGVLSPRPRALPSMRFGVETLRLGETQGLPLATDEAGGHAQHQHMDSHALKANNEGVGGGGGDERSASSMESAARSHRRTPSLHELLRGAVSPLSPSASSVSSVGSWRSLSPPALLEGAVKRLSPRRSPRPQGVQGEPPKSPAPQSEGDGRRARPSQRLASLSDSHSQDLASRTVTLSPTSPSAMGSSLRRPSAQDLGSPQTTPGSPAATATLRTTRRRSFKYLAAEESSDMLLSPRRPQDVAAMILEGGEDKEVTSIVERQQLATGERQQLPRRRSRGSFVMTGSWKSTTLSPETTGAEQAAVAEGAGKSRRPSIEEGLSRRGSFKGLCQGFSQRLDLTVSTSQPTTSPAPLDTFAAGSSVLNDFVQRRVAVSPSRPTDNQQARQLTPPPMPGSVMEEYLQRRAVSPVGAGTGRSPVAGQARSPVHLGKLSPASYRRHSDSSAAVRARKGSMGPVPLPVPDMGPPPQSSSPRPHVTLRLSTPTPSPPPPSSPHTAAQVPPSLLDTLLVTGPIRGEEREPPTPLAGRGPGSPSSPRQPIIPSGAEVTNLLVAFREVSSQQVPFSPVRTMAPSPPPEPDLQGLQGGLKGLTLDELRTVAVFVPSLVVELVLQESDYQPFSYDIDDAAIVLVDLSGFTKLCEASASGKVSLQRQGSSEVELAMRNTMTSMAVGTRIYRMSNQAEQEGYGAETVREILNKYFGLLVEVIYRYGGDVIRIAGDALICLFRPAGRADVPTPTAHARRRGDVVERALRCAEECVRAIGAAKDPSIPLDVHVGIGSGRVRCYHVGCDEFGWQVVVSGKPLKQVAEALEFAQAGEVVVSGEFWAQLEAYKERLHVQSSAQSGDLRKIVITPAAEAKRPRGGAGLSTERSALLGALKGGELSEEGKRRLLGYTPILVHAGVLEEGTGLQSEIRTVTVMFLMIDSGALDSSGSGDVLFQAISDAFDFAQETIVEHEGLIKELSVDDKGLVLVAGFGIASVMQDNFASQACRCALNLALGLNLMHLSGFIGLATGRVFCASLGNKQRREFALVSDTVNVAARLMVLGKKKEEYQLAHKQLASMAPDHARDLAPHVPCSVLLDKATQQRASASPRVVFEPREPVSVKGKAVLIDVFLPGLVACEGSLVTRRLSVDECMGEVVLYDHFEEAAARLLGCERVEEQLLDILWVRSEGNLLYLELLIEISRLLAPGKVDGGCYFLNSYEYSTLQALSSVVPDRLQEVFSRRLACLPRSYIIVLKVMTIIGEGSAGVVHFLFENQASLARYWDAQKDSPSLILESPPGATLRQGQPLPQQRPSKQEFLEVMRVLARYGFIDFDHNTECYSLREPLLVDHLYTSIPFRQRTALHNFAAEWFLEFVQSDATNAAVLYPLIIHHFNMAFEESRSASLLQFIKVLGPTYIDEWIRLRLSESPRLIDVAEHCASVGRLTERFLNCLAAFPWLRGLARMLHASKAGDKVVSFVKSLKDKWVRRVQERYRAQSRLHIMATRIQVAYRRHVWRRKGAHGLPPTAVRIASPRSPRGRSPRGQPPLSPRAK